MGRDEETVTMRMPRELYDQVRRQASTEDRSMSSLLRVAVREYLRRRTIEEQQGEPHGT